MTTTSVIFPARDAQRGEAIHAELSQQLRDFEVIPIVGADSFFDAWRRGIARAAGECFIFCHEDVRFLGVPPQPLEYYFVDGKTGLLGVAGTRRLDNSSPWWFSPQRLHAGLLSGQVWHDLPELKQVQPSLYGPFGNVVVLDGLCLVTTRTMLAAIGGVPVRNYGAWDYYDHILSLEFYNHDLLCKTVDFPVVHHSPGNRRPMFQADTQAFCREYLPGRRIYEVSDYGMG